MINPVIIKIAVWALVIKEIWLLMQIPSFADAVLSFITVGEIPGTNDTLSLSQMIFLLSGLFVIAAVLIFRKEVASGIRTLFGRSRPEAAQMPTPPVPAITFAAPEPYQEPQAQTPARPSVIRGVRRIIRNMKRGVAKAATSSLRGIRAAGVRGGAYLLPIATSFVDALSLLATIVADISVRLWRLVRPELERFDKYLEKKVRQNEYGSIAIGAAAEVSATVKLWWSEVKAKDTMPKLQRK